MGLRSWLNSENVPDSTEFGYNEPIRGRGTARMGLQRPRPRPTFSHLELAMHDELSRIDDALQALRDGGVVIVVDDEDRENEGDFVAAAEKVSPETIEFMITHGRGLLCMPILPDVGGSASARAHGRKEHGPAPDALHRAGGPRVVSHGHQRPGACADSPTRSSTRRTRPDELVRPGHLFPLVAKEGGVLRRAGHTEATVDLVRLAGLASAGVLCEVLDGTGVASRQRLHEIAREHDLPIVSIEGLIRYRRMREKLVYRVAEADLPTRYGRGRIIGYRVQHEPGNEPIAIAMGDLRSAEAPLVRLHSSCFTGDLLDSLRCDCGDQLHMALAMIGNEGAGALIYLPQEGQGDRADRENPGVQPSGQRAGYRAGERRTGLPCRHA